MRGNKPDSGLAPSSGFPNGVLYDRSLHTDICAQRILELPTSSWRKAPWFASKLMVRAQMDRNLAYPVPEGVGMSSNKPHGTSHRHSICTDSVNLQGLE